MHSTGQTSTQERSFTLMQGSTIMYYIDTHLPRRGGT